MADNDEVEAHDALSDERGIPEVAETTQRNNVLVAAFGIGIVALLLWFINQPDETQTPKLTDAEPQSFQLPARVDPPAPPEQSAETQRAATTAATRPDPYQRELEVELQRQALRNAEAAARLAEQRRRSPILVFDQANREQSGFAPESLISPALSVAAAPEGSAADANLSSTEAFAARISGAGIDTANAQFLQNPSTLLAQGTMIRGVLETAIQSDLAGFTRAQVAHDVYAFDGNRVLIPKGSRLVGRYQSGLLRGQTRVFIIWTRLIRPDGASIRIDSPGTDLLGRAGLSGDVDTHFFKTFGASILLTLIDGGIQVAAASASDNSNATTINTSGDNLSRAAEIALENSIRIPPTIHVDQGTPIQVFVAKDLDFIGVESTRR